MRLRGFHCRSGLPVHIPLLLLALSLSAAAECIPFQEAPQHIGDDACVTGKVLQVKQSKSGTWFLNFCEDYRACPFSAVVFASDLRDVGDVRELEGKQIEVHGHIQKYRQQTEIILRDIRQLRGEAAKIPPVPKNFDVSQRGHFSAGSIYSGSSSSKKSDSRQSSRRDPPDQPEPVQE